MYMYAHDLLCTELQNSCVGFLLFLAKAKAKAEDDDLRELEAWAS